METGIPHLSEHQRVETTQPQGYSPSPEEKKTLKLVQQLFDRAKEFRKRYDEKWLDNYKMFRGKQWKEQRPSYRHSEVINMVWQTIQSQVPILTDARQRFEFLPEEPSDTPVAKILDQVAESDWQRGNWSYVLTEILYDGHIIGTGVNEVGFDPDAKYGLGAITFDSRDPFYCFPDPNAFDVNHPRSKYFIYAEPIDIDVLKKQYPKAAKYLKPDLLDMVQADRTELNQLRYKSPVDNVTVVEGTRPDEIGLRQQALKVTLWLKDDTFEETEKPGTNEAGEPVVTYEQRLKYPNGRKICVASGVVLDDGPSPFEDGKFPFALYRNYIDPRSFWGISEVEPIEGPQKVLNKIYSFILDVLTLMGNPIWIIDDTADVDTDNLINRPGLVVEKAKDSEVKREEGVQLQPWIMQLLDRVKVYIDDMAGSQDVSRGAKPEGITAASAITALQEAAQTRVRQKSRNLDALLQCSGQLYKARVFQFYSTPRIIRITNDENAQEFFKFHIETTQSPDGSEQRVAHVRPFTQNPETGEYGESMDAMQYLIKGDFDVRVSTGSALPFAKDAKFGRIRQMFLDGVVDDEEYLKNADFPNWEAVLQRVHAKAAQAAQAEMAAQGLPAPSGETGGAPAPAA